MIIYDRTVVFNLIVIDQMTEETVFSDYFGSFEELNRFLENPTIKEPLIPEIKIDVCIVEQDENIVLDFTYELSSLDPLDEDELEEFKETCFDWLKPLPVDIAPKMTCNSTENNIEEKLPLLSYKYLCPKCWNEIDCCSCSSYPWYLIQIDEGIADIVKMLNIKGYVTTTSCEGHLNYGINQFYIGFNEKFDINLPDGFYWDGFSIRCNYKGKDLEEISKDKKEKLDIFRKTVELL